MCKCVQAAYRMRAVAPRVFRALSCVVRALVDRSPVSVRLSLSLSVFINTQRPICAYIQTCKQSYTRIEDNTYKWVSISHVPHRNESWCVHHCVSWLIYMCVLCGYVCRDSFLCVLIVVRHDSFVCVCHDSFMCVYMCVMTHLYVCLCVSWLISMCVCHCASWLICRWDMTCLHSFACNVHALCYAVTRLVAFSFVVHDSLWYMTHPYVEHMTYN